MITLFMNSKVLRFYKQFPWTIPLLFIFWISNLSLVWPQNLHLGHDSYWHISLIENAFDSFPPQLPIFAGESMRGYNYLLDFFLYLVTLLGFSSWTTYFIVAPLFYVLFITYLGTYFALKYGKSPQYVVSFLFFLFLASPFSYLLAFTKTGNILDAFRYPTTMQSVTSLSNSSHAFTLLIILFCMILLLNKILTIRTAILIGILSAIAIGVKFYGGIVLLFFIGINLFFRYLKDRSLSKLILLSFFILIPSFLSVLFFYQPFDSTKTGSIFGFSPMALIHPLIESPDGIYIPYFVHARYYIQAAGTGFSPRLLIIELISLVIFIVYNAGTRIIGFFQIFKLFRNRHKISYFDLSIICTILFSGSLTVLFVQKGGDWWNTVQFFGYTLFLFNIYAARSLQDILLLKGKAKFILVGFIIIATLPLGTELVLKSMLNRNIGLPISVSEVEALAQLKSLPHGVVFPIPPTFDSSYVSAYASKPVYYSNSNILSNIGVDDRERKKLVSTFDSLRPELIPGDYVYLKKNTKLKILIRQIRESTKYKQIYENEEVILFKKAN